MTTAAQIASLKHTAKVYMQQARFVRKNQPWSSGWYWTLMNWVAKKRREIMALIAASKAEQAAAVKTQPQQLALF